MDKNNYQPLISIVVATLNASTKIEKTLNSIISQTYPCKELIIIDGGSIDETIPILRRYQQHILYWESMADGGIYHAWNKALNHTRGEWLCFLGADDYFWDIYVLEKMLPHLNNARENDFGYVYGKSNILDKNGNVLYVEGRKWQQIRENFKRGPFLPIAHSGTFHHISLFRKYGAFDDSFKIAGDYEFLLRDLVNRDAYFADNVIVAGLPIGGISRNLDSKIYLAHEAFKAVRKHSNRIPWPILIILFQLYIFECVKTVYGRKNAACIADLYRENISGKQKMWSEMTE